MKVTKYFAVASIVLLAAVVAASTSSALAQSSIQIEVLDSVGGTTNPGAGSYTYTQGVNGSAILTATADDGWVFDHWVFSGNTKAHFPLIPEDNLIYDATIDVTHDYNTEGNVYTYQAVFVPASSATVAQPSVPTVYVAALAAVLAVAIAVVGFGAYRAGKGKAKL